MDASWVRKGLRITVNSLRKFAYGGPVSQQVPGPRVGVAFGGGFARGIAHVGVLKVLVENNIPIDALAGVSAGSLAAAGFASGCTIDEMLSAARALRWSRVGRWTFSRLGFATNERMESMLRGFLHCQSFEELKIPLSIVAADVLTGEAVTFRSGNLNLAVRASCAFPGLFVPVKFNSHLLVDGAIVTSVPVAALSHMGVDITVGVHIKTEGCAPPPTNLFQIVSESFQIIQNHSASNWRDKCDVVIEPRLEGIRWDDFACADKLVAAGEAAARETIPALRHLLTAHTVPTTRPARAIPRPAPLVLETSVRTEKV